MKRFSFCLKRALTACLLAAAIPTAGCATSTSRAAPLPAIAVMVSPGEKIMDGDKVIPLTSLPARLKKSGAGAATRIDIHLATDTSNRFMVQIKETLARAGYPKVVFIKARTATSYVND